MSSITITDPALLAQFAAAAGVVEIKGPDGRVFGTYVNDGYGKLPPGVNSPMSDEEFEEARKQPSTGLTLDQIWERIYQRHGRG